MLETVLLLIGIVVLLVSTEQLIALSSRLAITLRLSPLIIGITVIAIGTSLPELIVSSIAAYKADFGLAVGNILGSNIVNILLVLSLGIVFGQVRVGTTKTQKNIVISSVVSLVYLVSFWIHIPGIILSGILLGLATTFTVLQYRWGISGRRFEDKAMLKLGRVRRLRNGDFVTLFACLLLVIGGGFVIVDSVEKIALLTGHSTSSLGMSLTAIATSFPEIVATLIGLRQKQTKLLLGNIMGSNIYNVLLIGGISSLWIKDYQIPLFETGFFIFTALLFLIVITLYRGKIIPKKIGICLLALSFIYFTGIYI